MTLTFLNRHPENVNHLVFADPWGFPVRPEEDINRKRPLWVRAIVGVMSALGSPMSLMRYYISEAT